MIVKVIGKRRLLILSGLLALNGGLIAGLHFFFDPELNAALQRQQEMESEAVELRTKLENVSDELEFLRKNRLTYEALAARGFFSPQDRLSARRTLDTLRQSNRLISLQYEIMPQTGISNTQATGIGQEILESPVHMEADVFLDTDFLAFANVLRSKFPGQVELTQLKIAREAPLTNDVLAAIRRGEQPALAHGSLTLNWHSLLPHTATNLPGGGSP